MFRLVLPWVGALLWTLGAAAPGAAQVTSDDQRAQQHFLAGSSYFEQAQYEDALREFEQAHRLSKRPPLLLNIALAHERLLHFGEAADAIEAYLAAVPESPDRVTLETRRDNFRARAEAAAQESPTDPDGDDSARSDQGATSAEPARPTAEAAVRPSEGGLTGAGWAGVVTLALGGALGVVALGTGLKANGIYNDLESDCRGGVCDADQKSNIDKGDTLAVTSTALTGVALAAGVTGLVLLLVGRDATEEAPPVAMQAAPGYVGLSSEWRF